MKCRWCQEKLVYFQKRGWLHESDLSMYKQKLVFPDFCLKCGGRLRSGYCSPCGIQHERERVDDHCALPVRE